MEFLISKSLKDAILNLVHNIPAGTLNGLASHICLALANNAHLSPISKDLLELAAKKLESSAAISENASKENAS